MQEDTQNQKITGNIEIVMVGTTHPGNIGAAARAMHNMCFSNLILVDPQCPVGEVAYARSSGAHHILDQRRTVATLQDAIDDCQLVVGLTARHRSLPWPELNPQQMSEAIINNGATARTALIFGREHSGLTNEELMLCNYMVSIPTNPDFSSLNVASAIQVMCYEIYQRLMADTDVSKEESSPAEPLATAREMEGYFIHLEQVITATGFLNIKNPGLLMKRLRRIFQRVDLSQAEVNILRGILSSVEKYKSKGL